MYICLYCGRLMKYQAPHKCKDGFRKRKLKFISVMNKEERDKLVAFIQRAQDNYNYIDPEEGGLYSKDFINDFSAFADSLVPKFDTPKGIVMHDAKLASDDISEFYLGRKSKEEDYPTTRIVELWLSSVDKLLIANDKWLRDNLRKFIGLISTNKIDEHGRETCEVMPVINADVYDKIKQEILKEIW